MNTFEKWFSMSPDAQAARRNSPVTRRAGIIAGIVAGILAVCVCAGICSAFTSTGGNNASANSASTSVRQKSSATNTPSKPTATPVPLHDPALGGTEADFTAKYGNPRTCVQATCYDLIGNDGTPYAGMRATVAIMLENGRVNSVVITPNTDGVAWSQAEYLGFLTLYVPPDAKFVRNYKDSLGNTEMIYRSASLGKTLSSDDFTNGDTGNSVAAGTFAVFVDSATGDVQYAPGM